MANVTRTSYLAQEIYRQLIEVLDDPWLGLPTEIKLSRKEGTYERERNGRCLLQFWNRKFFVIGYSSIMEKAHGQVVTLKSIEGSVIFPSQMEAVDYTVVLERFAGSINWHVEHFGVEPNGTRSNLKFKVDGLPLERLKFAGECRRKGLPTYVWDAPDHPFNQ